MSSVAMIEQTAGKGAARAAARKRKRNAGGAGANHRPGWVTYTILGVVLLISAYPLYYSFLLGTSDAQTIAQNPVPSLVPAGHFFDNMRRVLESDIQFWKALSNSVIVASLTSLSVVIFSTLAGFSFSKLRFKGRNALLVFVIATMAVPTQLGIVPLFIVMAELNWTGKLVAVIVPAMVTAFGVFWMTQYLEEALPYELIEAARIDGCSMIRTFWHVALPAARPAAAMLALFTFVGSWTNFFWPFIVLGSSNPTLPVAVQLLQASYFKDYSLILAGVTLSTIPLILVFAVAGKHLVSGIMQGAVKG
ncbi:carbohydrate ABC transporter permease [Pengzhenrongella frigida]|uniref:Carbohydrate ABC transporter permease n=1 Tax=Pengzhenrongella frigida TaxID=1259133 RepID=A0A4Q5MW79_9MICO|nr:carbohydrate ABC transporter permease [Cellulomonas sp. HLT2-17]RYV49838.1 carbohydrate ABC transporter permease [Cellulomonas sp. HLT2-17]